MSENVDTLRIGIVGAGANTRLKHIPELQRIDGVVIVGVCNRTPESSQAVARDYRIERIYDNWRDLVDDPDIDAVVIGTWPDMHAIVTIEALRQHKHVLCEARMARTAAEARAMLEAANARPHLIAHLVPAPFTLHVDSTVARLLMDGFLGDVLVVDLHTGGTFVDQTSPLHWRQDASISGYNVLSLGIWYETIVRWIGEAERVTARTKTFVTTRTDSRDRRHAVRVPDHVDVTADMANGAQAHLQISAVTGLGPTIELTLYGTEGTLRFDGQDLYGARRGAESLEQIQVTERLEDPWRVERDFVAAIRGEQAAPATTFVDGVRYMEFTEAVARSAADGTTITLPLV